MARLVRIGYFLRREGRQMNEAGLSGKASDGNRESRKSRCGLKSPTGITLEPELAKRPMVESRKTRNSPTRVTRESELANRKGRSSREASNAPTRITLGSACVTF
jgi:hypothetical protein